MSENANAAVPPSSVAGEVFDGPRCGVTSPTGVPCTCPSGHSGHHIARYGLERWSSVAGEPGAREPGNDFPRRIKVYEWTDAERAIKAALEIVEGLGADVRLTDAVVLLGAAQTRVADFIDGVDGYRTVPCQSVEHFSPALPSTAAPQAEQADALWTAEQCEEVLNRKAPPHYGELAFIAMSLRARLAAATERAEGAEAAFARYAEHDDACKIIPWTSREGVTFGESLPPHPCTCGLDAARAALAARTATPHEARPAE